MSNYKEQFITLLSERERLIEEQTSYSRKVREIGEAIDNNKDEALIYDRTLQCSVITFSNNE